MNFKEGLLHAYQNRRTDGEITDAFYLYCRLSDLCSSSYEDKRKVRLLYAVDKRLCVFESMLKKGKDGVRELKDLYPVVAELLSEEKFFQLIDCVAQVCRS